MYYMNDIWCLFGGKDYLFLESVEREQHRQREFNLIVSFSMYLNIAALQFAWRDQIVQNAR